MRPPTLSPKCQRAAGFTYARSVTEARPAPTRQAGVRLLTGVPKGACAVTGDRTPQTLPVPSWTHDHIPTRTLRGETGGAGSQLGRCDNFTSIAASRADWYSA